MTYILYAYIAREKHDFLLREILPSFSGEFQKKILKYKRWEDAQLSLLGRFLLKHGLQYDHNNKYDDNELHYSYYSKPYFKDQRIKFNISHSGNIVVCVITEVCDIGVDIEILEDVKIEDFKEQMTTAEWERIVSSNDKKGSFFEYWTQKEAVIKAHGMGLSIPLQSFEVINNKTMINEENFFLKEIKLDNKYKCHIAFKEEIDSIVLPPQRINLFVNDSTCRKLLVNNS